MCKLISNFEPRKDTSLFTTWPTWARKFLQVYLNIDIHEIYHIFDVNHLFDFKDIYFSNF